MYRTGLGVAIAWFGAAAAWGAEPPKATENQAEGASSNAALFEQLDTSHDGQLSREEIPDDKRALFERLLKQGDGDKNGRLSRDEFVAGLESRRPKRAADEKLPAGFGGLPSPEAMDDIFRHLDRNQDGKVSPDEVPDEGRERFDRLSAYADTDGDGSVSKEEFQTGIERIRRPLAGRNDLDPKEIFEHLDRNADGKLTADEVPSEIVERFKRGVQFGDRDRDGAERRRIHPRRDGPSQARAVAGDRRGQRIAVDFAQGFREVEVERCRRQRKGQRKGKAKGKGVGRLAKLDADHDGKVSFAEYTSGDKKRFERLDKNQDGVLDRDEIRQAAEAHAVKTGVRKAASEMEQAK